ncbi:hypothetical protein REJC140_02117 [Pseudorhizobium endolithicum]|uniref:Uncharacterized protein n=1 Tax=Pseudorhizobium endolithicum TaxID=1191678 RepID=A0ABM8PXV2_9HYPH|nr:hypothetical protein [Pseudorhizobium endolithicum]CAD6424152.1 hypothetical protein REQ54_02584 [Rhizobium sp. Q54]CAD7054222.1 hypothetical protein REJC140_02117 [Pseudorhizobium endolithicum]
MKTTNAIIAAAFIAAAALGTVASAAEGNYYPGAGGSTGAIHGPGIDRFTTQGINPVSPRPMRDNHTIDSGDYYQGVDRNR